MLMRVRRSALHRLFILAPLATAPGSTVLLVCVNATQWISPAFQGPWTVT